MIKCRLAIVALLMTRAATRLKDLKLKSFLAIFCTDFLEIRSFNATCLVLMPILGLLPLSRVIRELHWYLHLCELIWVGHCQLK